MTAARPAPGPIGQRLRRMAHDRLLRGNGRFSDDVSLPGQAHAVMVRTTRSGASVSVLPAGGQTSALAVQRKRRPGATRAKNPATNY